jgi:hypothetical protein
VKAVEIKKGFILVGAEEEHRQLELLLKERAKFTGSSLFDSDDEVDDTETKASGSKMWTLDMKQSTKTTGKKKVVGFGQKYAEVYGLGTSV